MRIHNTFLCALLIGAMISVTSCSNAGRYSDTTDSKKAVTLPNADFEYTVSVKIQNNTDTKIFDVIRPFSLNELGIDKKALLAEDNIEFSVGGNILPTYRKDGEYWIRIPEIPANGEVSVAVSFGRTEKTDFNGSDVFEIACGDIELFETPMARTALSICKNGDLITGKCTGGVFVYERSTDGGLTWSDSVQLTGFSYPVENGEWIKDSTGRFNKERRVAAADFGGFISNTETGDIFICINEYWQYTCMKLDENGNVWLNGEGRSETDRDRSEFGSVNHIWKSSDNGESWTPVCSINNNDDCNKPQYSLFYGNGIVAPSYDGNGTGVDYIFSVSGSDDCADNFYCTTLFSQDNGITWKYSKGKLTLHDDSTSLEGGLSEPTLASLSDGRIVMIMRNQSPDSVHFAVSYSEDCGQTWGKPFLSKVFAPNTQPLLDVCNGDPILLWGGNNLLGGTSYMRYPFSLARLSRDNAQDIKAIYDISIGSPLLQDYSRSLFTNPAFLIFEYEGKTRLVAMGGANCRGCVVISDLEDYLNRTKGVFDSFEDGIEPWVVLPIHSGNTIASAGNASIKKSRSSSDGNYVLAVSENTTVSRSFRKSVEIGSIQTSFAIPAGGSVTFELQTALTDSVGQSPYLSVVIGDGHEVIINGSTTPLKTKNGINNLKIEFENQNHTVKITINGNTFDTVANTKYGDLVSFFNLTTSNGSTCELDRFILIDSNY